MRKNHGKYIYSIAIQITGNSDKSRSLQKAAQTETGCDWQKCQNYRKTGFLSMQKTKEGADQIKMPAEGWQTGISGNAQENGDQDAERETRKIQNYN